MPNERQEFTKHTTIELLVACRRRCCICHRFCGTKIEVHHIEGAKDGSPGNAIALCFDCHAEVGHYNPEHPKGKKYTPNELKLHRDQWLKTCEGSGHLIASTPAQYEPGFLEALVNELEFNKPLWSVTELKEMACPFEIAQFDRCMLNGSLVILEETLRTHLFEAYRIMKEVNLWLVSRPNNRLGSTPEVAAANHALKRIQEKRLEFDRMHREVIEYLSTGR